MLWFYQVSPQPETEFGKCSMSKKVHMRGESGTCNVCSAPCSSCMHLNRALMGSRTDEFSDESCRVNAASQYSVNESGTLSSLKSRVSDNLQHTTSETSNLHSVNSSHDSFSENADSKASLRSTIISDASEDVVMLPKLASGGTIAEDQLSSKPRCSLDQRTFSNKYEEIKEEGHDDNISCVRPNDATVVVSNHNRNINSSTASVSSLALEGSGKVTQFNKLGSSEIPSSKDADASSRSLNVQSPYTDSRNAKSLSYNTNFTDIEENPSSLLQDKVPECSMDHVNSSLSKEEASEIVSVRKSVSCKASHIGGSSEVSMKSYPKSEAETNKDSGDRTDGELKSSDRDEHNDKSNELVESPDMQEPPLQSGSGDESDESDIVEQDVSNDFFLALSPVFHPNLIFKLSRYICITCDLCSFLFMFFRLVSVGPPTLFSSMYPVTLKCFSRLVSDWNVRLASWYVWVFINYGLFNMNMVRFGRNENGFEEIYGT